MLVISLPIFLIFLPNFYPILQKYMAIVLIVASLFLILVEKNIFWAFFLFMLSGILGIAAFSLPLKQPLFPLLTGLFGTSMLFTSIKQKTTIPKQKIYSVKISGKEIRKIIPASLISSSLCSFLPGLGASQAAVIGSEISGKISHNGFLVLLGSISTLVAGLNFVSIYAVSKPRSGVAVIAEKLIGNFSLFQLWFLVILALFVGCIAFFLSLFFSKLFARKISNFNYEKISLFILIFLFLMSFIFSGWLGLLVLISATAIGIVAIEKGIRKMHLMGSIMLPIILYFLPF
jgi:putative membrane protein